MPRPEFEQHQNHRLALLSTGKLVFGILYSLIYSTSECERNFWISSKAGIHIQAGIYKFSYKRKRSGQEFAMNVELNLWICSTYIYQTVILPSVRSWICNNSWWEFWILLSAFWTWSWDFSKFLTLITSLKSTDLFSSGEGSSHGASSLGNSALCLCD